jgi:LacI family transcriptional regulator
VIDDFQGGYMATQHLIEQGCKRIAHFTNARMISIYTDRWKGYMKALSDNGIGYDPALVVECDLQLADGKEAMHKLLELDERPDAVFSASAYGAMGAMQVLKEKGISIPGAIALVAFSNEPFTEFTEPALTTVDQHSVNIGNVAARMFLSEATSKKTFIPQKVILRPELIVRGSSMKKVTGQ